MRRVGKGCSRVKTPLFEGMLVAREPEEHGNEEEHEVVAAVSETVSAAAIIPFDVPETISAAVAIPTKAAKRRKLNDKAQEAKYLKKRLEVVDDEDDDVFTEATPLARKVPVVDYQIVLINNKPKFKIIKADETHQLYN
nr:hypothetical protein [Tanacetum cinerariifolium]